MALLFASFVNLNKWPILRVRMNWFRRTLFIPPKLLNSRKHFWCLTWVTVLFYSLLLSLAANALELEKRERKGRRLKLTRYDVSWQKTRIRNSIYSPNLKLDWKLVCIRMEYILNGISQNVTATISVLWSDGRVLLHWNHFTVFWEFPKWTNIFFFFFFFLFACFIYSGDVYSVLGLDLNWE